MLDEDKALAALTAAAAYAASTPGLEKYAVLLVALGGFLKAVWPAPTKPATVTTA
jgi:hypothetical protein